MSRIAVLGTGLLGAGFAHNLLRQGHDVVVWNRTIEKTAALVEAGATAAENPAAAVKGADRVHLVLTADDAVDSVIEAARAGLAGETWVIDHSTNAPARVAERHRILRGQGVRYVPAPVFMSPANSHEGTGLMLLAASDADAATLVPILSTMTGQVWHVGERPDLAAVYKIMGNGVLVSVAGLMGDLYTIGQQNDLTPDQVDTLFENFRLGSIFPRTGGRVRNAASMDTSFALTMARKDVGLMVDAAGGPDSLTVLPAVASAMDQAIQTGDGERDFAIMAWRTRPDEG